jgi:hypothetical protein
LFKTGRLTTGDRWSQLPAIGTTYRAPATSQSPVMQLHRTSAVTNGVSMCVLRGFPLHAVLEFHFGLTQEAVEPLLLLLRKIAGRL